MIEDLARLILEAQRIREESFSFSSGKYKLSIHEAALQAGESSGLDTRADELVNIMLTCAWNDFGSWAEYCLAKVFHVKLIIGNSPPPGHIEKAMLRDECKVVQEIAEMDDDDMFTLSITHLFGHMDKTYAVIDFLDSIKNDL